MDYGIYSLFCFKYCTIVNNLWEFIEPTLSYSFSLYSFDVTKVKRSFEVVNSFFGVSRGRISC